MYKKVLIIVLFLWFETAIFRTVGNFTKIYSEELVWLDKTKAQKQLDLFGKDFILFDYVKSKTVNDGAVVIYSQDAKPYLYGRYFLYPRKIIQVRNIDEFEKSMKNNKNSLFILYGLEKENKFYHMLTVEKSIDSTIVIGKRR